MTQEDFDDVTSRVYVSALERGVKQPTLRKVDELAAHLRVHPLSLLMLAYFRKGGSLSEVTRLYEHVALELARLFPEKRQVDEYGDPTTRTPSRHADE